MFLELQQELRSHWRHAGIPGALSTNTSGLMMPLHFLLRTNIVCIHLSSGRSYILTGNQAINILQVSNPPSGCAMYIMFLCYDTVKLIPVSFAIGSMNSLCYDRPQWKDPIQKIGSSYFQKQIELFFIRKHSIYFKTLRIFIKWHLTDLPMWGISATTNSRPTLDQDDQWYFGPSGSRSFG